MDQQHLNGRSELGLEELGLEAMTSDPEFTSASRDLALQVERHAALRRLAASLSHAIGTPLNVISGRAELIELDTQALPEVLDSAITIRRQVGRITRLVNGALKYIDALDPNIPRGSVADLVDDLRAVALAAGWQAEFSLSGPATAAAPRSDAVRAYVLGLCRLGAQLGQTAQVQLATTDSGLQATLRLSPGLRVKALQPALEPWLETDTADSPHAEAPSARRALTAPRAVQLAIALGCARDAGAELELTQDAAHTSLSATWRS